MRKEGKQSAIYMALGAASMCWENPHAAGVFDSERAKAIGDVLSEALGQVPLITARDAEWLLGLLQNAVPSAPGNSEKDWEGPGRAYAEELLARAMDGREHPTEVRLRRLGDLLADRSKSGARVIRIDDVMEAIV